MSAFNMVDMMKVLCAVLVHATPDGKCRISKSVLDQMPDNFGSIMEVTDLGDAYLIRILGIEKLEVAIPPQGLILPSGRAGARDVRPVIDLN